MQSDSAVQWNAENEQTYHNVGTGTITVVPATGSGVTINYANSVKTGVDGQGETIYLKKVGANQWDMTTTSESSFSTGFSTLGAFHIADRSTLLASASINSQVPGTSFTVGPTGSAADIILSSLDNIPLSAGALTISVTVSINSTGLDNQLTNLNIGPPLLALGGPSRRTQAGVVNYDEYNILTEVDGTNRFSMNISNATATSMASLANVRVVGYYD
jgi:hypothetical protein